MATNATNNSHGRAADPERIPLTREGYDENQARLTYLITERRQQVADYIHEAKEAGDISESSAYEDAKNLQAMVEGEIQELSHLLEHAVILETPQHTGGKRTVRLGTTIDVETDRGTSRTFTLVSSAEANSSTGKLSDQSPVGRALMGHAIGDKIEVTTPGGTVLYTVKDIH
ncbi:MAG TPA: transcription elongation factor GreA [Ktedonobacterales bacterium]|nr:transcription elongation factor GreA [Ktedonobacterales bacterium]